MTGHETAALLDRDRLREAFERLGVDLARRGVFVELAVYGGSAIMLQFAWRASTKDVDAVVRPGYDEGALAPSVAAVAASMGLPPGWLNDAVGMFTPLREPDDLFNLAGSFPSDGPPGLRVLVATPTYLLALKLQALASTDRGDRDLKDARQLAAAAGLTRPEELSDLYAAIHDERPPKEVAVRFCSVIEETRP